jgi:hypothetical protein
MDLEIAIPPVENVGGSVQYIHVRVDGLNEKARQDVYERFRDGTFSPYHTVIADYRTSVIMEKQGDECSITTFDKSLNLISNLITEMWTPKLDSFTSYLGVQSIAMAPGRSFYGFKTFSSDDVEWTVFFDTVSRRPEYAVSE